MNFIHLKYFFSLSNLEEICYYSVPDVSDQRLFHDGHYTKWSWRSMSTVLAAQNLRKLLKISHLCRDKISELMARKDSKKCRDVTSKCHVRMLRA